MNPRKLRHLGTREVKRTTTSTTSSRKNRTETRYNTEPFVTDHRDNIKLDRLKT